MWLAIAFIASIFLVVAISPKVEVENARAQSLGENAFPTSKYGDVVPIIYGTVEQRSPIVTWYGDFRPVALTEEVKTGFFSSSEVITGYRYLIGFDLALCLGPNAILRQIKIEGGKLVWGGGVARAGDSGSENIAIQGFSDQGGGIEWHPGNFDQNVSTYMNSNTASGGAGVQPCPRYRGICHAVFKEFYIGPNPTPKRYSFVIERLTENLSNLYSIIGSDLNPMEIAYSILTETWGHLGIDSGLVDVSNFQSSAETLYNEGIGMSILVGAEKSGKDVLEECMRVADGVLYQEPSTGLIKVKLIREDYTVGSLLVLDETNIIGDLKSFGKTTWESTFNQVRVQFQSREMEYDSQVAMLQDFANVNYQGKLKSTSINMPGVKSSSVASEISRRQLSLVSVPLFKAEIVANRTARNLRPGDVFVLNWPAYGLTNAVMRVLKINLGTLQNNEVSITCVQDRFASDTAIFSVPGSSGHVDITNTPQEISSFMIWEPPSFFLGNTDQVTQSELDSLEISSKVMVQAERPASGSVSFDVHMGPTSDVPGVAMSQAPYYGKGLLESTYSSSTASDDGVDTSSSLIVYNLSDKTVDSLINNATFNDARYGTSMFRIGSELFSYVGFTDLGSGRVQFTDVYRALLDTKMQTHFANADVWFIYRNAGLVPIDINIGSTSYFKLLDRTTTSKYNLDSATATSLVMSGKARKPLPPTYLTVDGSRNPPAKVSETSITVAWKRRTRLDPKLYAYNENYDSSLDSLGAISHRVRYTLDSDPTVTVQVDDTGVFVNSYDIDVTGMVGTLVIQVDSIQNSTGRYSETLEQISVELT